MGNRGTTPSWDDEQIAKYGLLAHLGFVNRMDRVRRRRELNARLLVLLRQVLKSRQELESLDHQQT